MLRNKEIPDVPITLREQPNASMPRQHHNLDTGNPRITVATLSDLEAAVKRLQTFTPSGSSFSGGTIYIRSGIYPLRKNIVLPSFITLQGEGRDSTRIDFGDNPYSIQVTGNATTRARNVRIRDLTIERSTATSACTISYADHFILDNVRFSDNSGNGLRVVAGQQYTVFNCLSDNNGDDGFDLDGVSNYQHSRFTYIGCIATQNTGNGFAIQGSSANIVGNGAFVSCEADGNTLDGFDINNGAVEAAIHIDGCIANSNTVTGFDINATDVFLTGCKADTNTVDGIEITATQCAVQGCSAINNGTLDYDFTQRVTFSNNILEFGGENQPSTKLSFSTAAVSSWNNTGGSFATNRVVSQMGNSTSSTSVAQGAVVTHASVASGEAFDVTTTEGDDKVAGMLMFATGGNQYGAVMHEGYTTLLKVDGTTDIAIGDFLGTSSIAGIAKKITSGMAFAIALEAYTTDDASGTIDALLIKPRKIGSGGGNFDTVAKQEDTTNTDPWTDTIDLQTGWGYIQGNDATIISETVTFPHAFAAPPFVTATALERTTSAPNSIDDFTIVPGNLWGVIVGDIVSTSFTVTIAIEAGVTLPSTSYFGYTWQATGTT